MHGVEITEKNHTVLIAVDTDVIDRARIEHALSLLRSEMTLARAASALPAYWEFLKSEAVAARGNRFELVYD